MSFYAACMKRFKIKFFLIIFFTLILFASCKQNLENQNLHVKNHPGKKVQWNFLIYMAADNELEKEALNNILEMRKTGSSDELNILVLLDRSPGFDTRFGNWQGTKLFRLRKGEDDFSDDEIYDFEELNMKDAGNLNLFLDFAERNFPSEHTLLTLWSHGFALYPEGTIGEKSKGSEISRSIISDYTTDFKTETSMSVQNLAEALKNHRIDILHFDACNMAMMEIIWEIESCAEYVISSQLAVPSCGMNYKGVLNLMNQNPFIDRENLASSFPVLFSEKYEASDYRYSLSCVSTNQFRKFMEGFTSLCGELKTLSESDLEEIKKIRKMQKSISPDYEEQIDLISFLDECSACKNLSVPLQLGFDTCSGNLKECLSVKNDRNTDSEIKGLSINFPINKEQFLRYSDKNFARLKIYEATDFDIFLCNLQ